MNDQYSDFHRFTPPPEVSETPSGPSVRVCGGVTRVSTPSSSTPEHQQPQQQLSVPESTRVYGGTLSYTNGDAAAVESGGIARYVAGFGGTPGGSVWETRQQQGQHLTVQLEPGNEASRTQVSIAVKEGLLKRAVDGGYEDTGNAAVQALKQRINTPEEAPAEAQGDPAVFDAEDEADLQRALTEVPQHAYDVTQASVMAAVMQGEDLSKASARLATEARMDPQTAADYVHAGHAVWERAVARAVALRGISAAEKPAFYEFARSQPSQLQNALQRMVYMKDPGGFDGLAAEWLRHNPR